MTAPTGTSLTVATMNDDWASAGSNYAEVADVDVAMIQEGRRAKYADLVAPTHRVLQDTSTPGKAGSVVVSDKRFGSHGKGWTFAVKAPGLMARYLAWVLLSVGDRRVLFIAAHRPPKWAAHRLPAWVARAWGLFDLALAARVKMAKAHGHLVVVGIDANEANPEQLAKACGLVWHSQGLHIDGFLASPSILFSDLTLLDKGTSDHQPIRCTITVPPKAPKPVKSPPPFEHVVYNGKLMDQKTKAFVQKMEKRLGYPLTIEQGCYNPGGVAASGGTHDGGGVVDLSPWDADRKVRVARKFGAFAWHRLPIPGLWGEHIHLGIRNHGALSAAAQSQQVQYDHHPATDGLAPHRPDPTWHPSPPVTFVYPPRSIT